MSSSELCDVSQILEPDARVAKIVEQGGDAGALAPARRSV